MLPNAVMLEGASNFRDLGGWPAAEGRLVRPGLVFRAASLAGLTSADRATLAGLGLRTGCDLRSRRESESAPSGLPDGVRRVAVPVHPRIGASLHELLLRQATTGETIKDVLRQTYHSYAGENLDAFRPLLVELTRPEAVPLVFHCSAGKDRTGFAAALLLTVLGAGRESIVADYVATDRLWNRANRLPQSNPDAVVVVLQTHPDLLLEALDLAAARFGGVEGLIARGLGLADAQVRALRERLLA